MNESHVNWNDSAPNFLLEALLPMTVTIFSMNRALDIALKKLYKRTNPEGYVPA